MRGTRFVQNNETRISMTGDLFRSKGSKDSQRYIIRIKERDILTKIKEETSIIHQGKCWNTPMRLKDR